MPTEVIVGMLSLVGTAIGSLSGVVASSKLTAYRIEQLEQKVDKHNNFAEKIPVIQQRLDDIESDVDHIKEKLNI